MKFSLKNKVIVVTGGNGLLGKQFVNAFFDEGATVIPADINFTSEEKNNLVIDITDEENVKQAIATIVTSYGKIDGWINNAYPRTQDWGKKLPDIPIDSWRKNVDMHLNGYFLCCRLVAEQMKKQNYGSLINMSSIYGLVGPDFSVYDGTEMTMPAAYAAIKGGINNLTRYLAAYYGPYQVRINALSPGGIFDNQPEAFVKNYNKKVPMGRMGTPGDIVSAAHYLLSDEACYVTGHNLIVDGGWTSI